MTLPLGVLRGHRAVRRAGRRSSSHRRRRGRSRAEQNRGEGADSGPRAEAGDACAWSFPGPLTTAPPPGMVGLGGAAGAPPALATNAVLGGRAVLLQGVPDGRGGCAHGG